VLKCGGILYLDLDVYFSGLQVANKWLVFLCGNVNKKNEEKKDYFTLR